MKSFRNDAMWILTISCICLICSGVLRAQDQAPVDWDRVMTLMQKRQTGQQLTAEESTYLDRARQIRRNERNAPGGPPPNELSSIELLLIKRQLGGRLNAEENAQIDQARRTMREARRDQKLVSGVTVEVPRALTAILKKDRYKGERPGLYGTGLNVPPARHWAAAKKFLRQIRLLDSGGSPDPNGKIVLLSIGMSNTTQEFSFFKRLADQSTLKRPQLVIVDGAQGGRTANQWADGTETWNAAVKRLEAGGVTPKQVQTIWLKLANGRPASVGEHPIHTRKLQEDLLKVVQIAKERFPNLQIVYLSSRIFGGYATTPLNPEPYAYESAFAVRDLIRNQITGQPELNYDPSRGPVKAPILLWGPYLWGDPTTARSDNGINWAPEDFMQDGTHPSPFGRAKVAAKLYDFFTTSPFARSWFLKYSTGSRKSSHPFLNQ